MLFNYLFAQNIRGNMCSIFVSVSINVKVCTKAVFHTVGAPKLKTSKCQLSSVCVYVFACVCMRAHMRACMCVRI